MSNSIRVLVADDHAIVRKGLCALLATEPGIEVVGLVRDGREAAHDPASDLLTTGETDVLQFVARGMTDREISSRLRIGKATVRSVVSSILARFDLRCQPLAGPRA